MTGDIRIDSVNGYSPALGLDNNTTEAREEILFDTPVEQPDEIQETQSVSIVPQELSAQQLGELLNSGALNDAMTDILESIVLSQEEAFLAVKENNGILAKGWDWFKNTTGLGAGSNKTQDIIDNSKTLIEELKQDPSKLKDIYKEITGNELNIEELSNLYSNKADFSKSELMGAVSKYSQGQNMAINTASGILSALAVTGLVVSGIFTGGLSVLAAGAICVGAGTAAYMVPQAIDGLTEKDGYSSMEIAQDVATGVLTSAVTTVSMGTAKGLTGAISSKIGDSLGKFAAGEATALMMGDGIAVGNYLAQAGVTRLDDLSLTQEDEKAYRQIVNQELKEGDEGYEEALIKAQKYYDTISNNTDFSLKGLGTTAAVSSAASLAGGAAAFGMNATVGNVAMNLTQNSSAIVQTGTRIALGTATGASAGAGAAFVAGGANYLLTTNLEDMTFEDWLNSSLENEASGAIAGAFAGMAFEAVQVSAKTPAPEGTKSTNFYKSQNGTGIEYLDENGNVIARDISAKDINAYLQSNETLKPYNPENPNEPLVMEGAKTVRFYPNGQVQQINYWDSAIQGVQTSSVTVETQNLNSDNQGNDLVPKMQEGLSVTQSQEQVITVDMSALIGLQAVQVGVLTAEECVGAGSIGANNAQENLTATPPVSSSQIIPKEENQPSVINIQDIDETTILKVGDSEIELAKYRKVLKKLKGDPEKCITLGTVKNTGKGMYKIQGLPEEQTVRIYGDGRIECDYPTEITSKESEIVKVENLSTIRANTTLKEYKDYSSVSRDDKLRLILEKFDPSPGEFEKMMELSDKELEVILNTASGSLALNRYKNDARHGFREINKELELNAQGQTTGDERAINDINEITALIEQNTLPEGITLYRYEGYSVLNNVVDSNGNTINLGQTLKELDDYYKQTGDRSKIDEFLREQIENPITYQACQSHFMSTNIGSFSSSFENYPVAMELQTAPNTKGVYLLSDGKYSSTGNELEILLQRNSNVNVAIDYDFTTGQWHLIGTVFS
ncbi:MAG: hypothetical protein IJ877_03890 [Candidatus Gastranaerophilales bacterium]|nr:hypothetical protein [Candidatus Gastranaerophilales bacterium]